MAHVMSKKDLKIRNAIENILESNSSGQRLKNYFADLPDKRIRRAMSVLSGIYPDTTTISDDDLQFILHMFSDIRLIGQDSFFLFVQAVNVFSFAEHQKILLRDAIKKNIEILCDVCTFELDGLLESLFEPKELFQYLEVLTKKEIRSVLIHVSDILRYNDFSKSGVSDERIENLKQEVYEFFDRIGRPISRYDVSSR